MDAGCHYTLSTLDATNYTCVNRWNGLFSCLFVFSRNYKHFQREKRGEKLSVQYGSDPGTGRLFFLVTSP